MDMLDSGPCSEQVSSVMYTILSANVALSTKCKNQI